MATGGTNTKAGAFAGRSEWLGNTRSCWMQGDAADSAQTFAPLLMMATRVRHLSFTEVVYSKKQTVAKTVLFAGLVADETARARHARHGCVESAPRQSWQRRHGERTLLRGHSPSKIARWHASHQRKRVRHLPAWLPCVQEQGGRHQGNAAARLVVGRPPIAQWGVTIVLARRIG